MKGEKIRWLLRSLPRWVRSWLLDTSPRRRPPPWFLSEPARRDVLAAKDVVKAPDGCHLELVIVIRGAADLGTNVDEFTGRIAEVQTKCEGSCTTSVTCLPREQPGPVPEDRRGKFLDCWCQPVGQGADCFLKAVTFRGGPRDRRILELRCEGSCSFGEDCKLARIVSPSDARNRRTVRVFCKCL